HVIGLCQESDTKRRSIIMPVTGPDFISLQARDLDASQAFYEQYLGLVRSPAGPPHAVVFETKPIALAPRDVIPRTALPSAAPPAGRTGAKARPPPPCRGRNPRRRRCCGR